MIIRIAPLCLFFFLVGCASNPPVRPAATSKSEFEGAAYAGDVSLLDIPTPGAEAYRAFYQGGSGFVSVASVRNTVEAMAARHCGRSDKKVRPLQETTSKAPHVLGNFPRVEWIFECVHLPSTNPIGADKISQLERLKKLLDSGALTQEEYEREKTKILGTQ